MGNLHRLDGEYYAHCFIHRGLRMGEKQNILLIWASSVEGLSSGKQFQAHIEKPWSDDNERRYYKSTHIAAHDT